jgi:hypothetical protein
MVFKTPPCPLCQVIAGVTNPAEITGSSSINRHQIARIATRLNAVVSVGFHFQLVLKSFDLRVLMFGGETRKNRGLLATGFPWKFMDF